MQPRPHRSTLLPYTMLASLYQINRSTTFFFFNDTATTEIYTLSIHDALPIYGLSAQVTIAGAEGANDQLVVNGLEDRKSTRLNSSHSQISYAVFCLKKKKTY